MEKITYKIKFNYIFDSSHRGAPYKIEDMDTFCNQGDFLEKTLQAFFNEDYTSRNNIPYFQGSDIESLKISVKSGGASLAAIYGENIEDILNTYFTNVASKKWAFVAKIDNECVAFIMNREEFENFVTEFGVLDTKAGTNELKVRLKKTSLKMLKWLEERS